MSTSRGDSDAPFWALMGFTVVLLLGPQQFFPWLGTIRIALVTAALAALAHLYQRFVRRRPLLSLSPEMIVSACLAVWAILSVPWSYWPGGSLDLLLGLYLKTLAMFWLLGNIVDSVQKLRLVFWGLAIMSIPLALTAVKNYFSGAFIVTTLQSQMKRIIGYDAPLTGNPNDLALVLNLILPLCVALLFISRRSLARSALLAVIGLNGISVIVTFSRAAFLTLVTIGCLYLWKLRHRPERGWVWAVLVVGLLCIPLMPSGYTDRLATITDIDADMTGSAQERWLDMVHAVKYVMAHPIVGAGVGMSILALNEERGSYWRAVHNVYLEHAVDLGFPGLVLFLLLLGGVTRNALEVQRRWRTFGEAADLFYLAEGLQISLVGFAVAGMFHPGAYHFYFYYVAGLAVAAKTVSQKEELSRPTGAPS